MEAETSEIFGRVSLVKRSRRLTTLTTSKNSDVSACVWCLFGRNTAKYYRMQSTGRQERPVDPAWPLMRSDLSASMIDLSACAVRAVRAYFL